MGSEELQELQDVVQEIAPLVPVEVLPVEAPPAQAVTWPDRLLWLFARHTYLLAFFGGLVENTVFLGFLLPGGAVVGLSAVGGRAAGLPLPLLAALAAAGTTGGAVIDYLLGRSGADRVLRHRWAGRMGQRFADQFDEAAPLLRRHGWWMMLVAHTFGHGRSALAVADGASHLPLRRFLAIEAIEVPAALIWSALYAGGGYVLGGELQTFELVLRRLGWFGAALVLAGFAAWWYRERHRAPPARGSPWLRRRALPAAADEGLVHGPGRSAPVESGAGGT